MLQRLIISDFAIIRHLEIGFCPGLNILSGETGAGKSIIINAVNLLLGGRANVELIREGAEEARVEGLFQIPKSSDVYQILEEMDIQVDGEIVIKRSISRSGKNRVSINGSLATVAMLTAIAPRLMSISGQHANQALLRQENHLLLLDDFAGLAKERESLAQTVRDLKELSNEIAQLKQEISKAQETQELVQLQIDEIERAGVRPGEDQELEQERDRLKFAQELSRITRSSYAILYENEDAVLSKVSRCLKELEKGAELDSKLKAAVNILSGVVAEVEEASYALRDYMNNIAQDPDKLEQVEDRIFLLNQLKRKYGPTLEDVLDYGKKIVQGLEDIEENKALLSKKEKALLRVREIMLSKASELSRKRRTIARKLEKATEQELDQLHMKGTVLKVHFANQFQGQHEDIPAEMIKEEGFDQVEFMISPNVGEPLRPLTKIASGGELSRLVLALKSILAKRASVETIIFDEVDSGISGATAEVVGDKLLTLSQTHQILCITHLPQIAAKGQAHFLVKKEVEGGRTTTKISKLDKKGRVMEIARLLGGKEITEKAISRAEEMLNY